MKGARIEHAHLCVVLYVQRHVRHRREGARHEALAVLGGHVPVPQNDTGEGPAGHPEFEAGPDFGSAHRPYVETLNAICR